MAPSEEKKPIPRKHILIVDNDDVIRTMYETKLSGAGFSISTLNDITPDFVEKVASLKPDLILLDIGFGPGGEEPWGLDATDALRADPRTAAVKIAYLTNFANKTDEARAIQQHVVTYFKKINLIPSQVVETLKEIFSRGEA